MPGKHLEAGVRHLPGAAILELRGEVDGFAEDVLGRAYSAAEETDPSAIILNLGDVGYINSKGIALLVVLIMRARQADRRILAYGLCEHFREIFRITRLSDYITLYEDEESALAGIKRDGQAAAGTQNRENDGNGTGFQAKA
ncbi:MAG TPA: STAS domain-containing protein [Anaerolineae bacterium]|nr:STAS domain-containing protein [Anaerolineae bacterium]